MIRFVSSSRFTIWDKLCLKLGREPTDAEVKAEVERIKREASRVPL